MKKLLYYILFTQLLIISATSYSQWSTDPYNNLIVGYGLLPEIASDSAGGCYITYEQNLGYPRHLAMERLNKYGYKTWSSTITISGELPEQRYSHLIADGYSGTIIAYLDLEFYQIGGISRLRLQRVDSSGHLLWGSNGVRTSLAEANQDRHTIVSDEEGGCVVAWLDSIDVLRVQRIDAQGLRVWSDSGIIIANNVPDAPTMISNKLVGVIIEYYSRLNGYKVQRINLLGQNLWGDGITVPTGAVTAGVDNIGNIYLFGRKNIGYRNGKLLYTLNLQKIDTSANIYFGSDGIVIDTLNTNRSLVQSFALSNNHGFLSWTNEISDTLDDKYQIIDKEGNNVLNNGGMQISSIQSQKSNSVVLASDSNTAIFLWSDQRNGIWNLYAQRRDTLGQAMWKDIDISVSLRSVPGDYRVTTDSKGGIIAAWYETSSVAILAQHVNRDGLLGKIIASVEDKLEQKIPVEFLLHQNYPNPFNLSTIIRYEVPITTQVKICVYNLLGQKLNTIIDKNYLPGSYVINYNQNDLPSGIYFYRLETQNIVSTRKLTIIK